MKICLFNLFKASKKNLIQNKLLDCVTMTITLYNHVAALQDDINNEIVNKQHIENLPKIMKDNMETLFTDENIILQVIKMLKMHSMKDNVDSEDKRILRNCIIDMYKTWHLIFHLG